MEIKLCKSDEDIHALAVLASNIWNEYFIHIISQEQIDYMIDKFLSYKALHKAIRNENYTYFLAYEDNQIAGFCGVKPEEERLFLSKLYLHSDYRGKGYSSILLRKAISLANELNINAIYLTCNKFNTHSLDIYKAKGFVTIDAVQTKIGKGFIMDDYIMQLNL